MIPLGLGWPLWAAVVPIGHVIQARGGLTRR